MAAPKFVPPAGVDKLMEAVKAWMAKRESLTDGVKIMSADEWSDRGETVGRGSVLTLILEESSLHTVLNYPETKFAFTICDEFHQLGKEQGYWVELGFSWSAHFYEC